MLMRRKMRNRIILLLLIAVVFIYWRGAKMYVKANDLDCRYHFAYAVCKQVGGPTKVPSLWDVLAAGAKF